jgi:hypothetical protein
MRKKDGIQNIMRKICLHCFIVPCVIVMTIVGTGCGGGGDGDVIVDEEFSGGSGKGSDDVTIFWRYFGGIGSGNAIQETSDGGFIIAGNQGSDFDFVTQDLYLAKADSQGNEEWSKTFGASQGQTANDVKQAADGGYIAVGYTDSGSSRDVYVVKTSADGKEEWSQSYDVEDGHDEGHALHEISDGYAVVGSGTHEAAPGVVQEDVWFFKIDSDGNKIPGSDRFYATSTPGWHRGYSMQMTRDDGFIIAGRGEPNAVFMIKTSADGTEQWSYTYGTGVAYSVCQAEVPDNGFILAGGTTPFEGSDTDLLIIKVNTNGNVEWRKIFGGGDMDVGREVAVTSDGGYIVAGSTESFSQGNEPWQREDVYLIKLDANGSPVWQNVKGMSPDNSELGNAVQATSDGGYIIAGGSQTQVMLAKFDEDGNTIRLGELDFAFNVPDTIGLISLNNALDIANTAVNSVSLPRKVGEFGLNLFIDALNNVSVDDLCDTGGSYSWDPVPIIPVSGGSPYELTFDNCVSGPVGSDQIIYNGSFTLTVDSLSDDLTSDDYDVRVTLGAIDVTTTDDVGDVTTAGGMGFSRISTSGNFAERSDNNGSTLLSMEDSVTENIIQFDINSLSTSGGNGLAIGNIGQYTIVDLNYLSGTCKVTVQLPIAGIDPDLPEQGELLVEAQDGSSLTLVVVNGNVNLGVDTNGDGTIDGILVTTWDEIN